MSGKVTRNKCISIPIYRYGYFPLTIKRGKILMKTTVFKQNMHISHQMNSFFYSKRQEKFKSLNGSEK